MQFRKGDKVRFLNETGEATVVRLLSNGQVLVETSEGFEYPYPAAQLVPVKPIEKETPKEIPVEEEAEDTIAGHGNPSVLSLNNRFPDGVFLGFIPKHQAFPSAGMIDLFLFNHTDYDIYFTISIKDGRDWICIESGAVRPRAKKQIETLTPQDIDNWNQLKTDVLFFSGDAYEHLPPVSNLTKLNGVKFFKDSTFAQHALTGNKAWVAEIFLVDDKIPVQETKPLTNDDIRRMMKEKEARTTGKKTSVPHLKNQSLEKEVDLHIEELLDNWSGMSNGQLLDVQLKTVVKELDEAIALHLRSVIFIHGIGNGRLKQEVRRVISTYKNVRFHDASFQRYGFGATEVEIL